MDHHLGEQIRQVGSRPLFGYPGHSVIHSFIARMVANNYVLLLQCRLRGPHVLIDSFIVTEHVGWYFFRDANHPQLVPKGFVQLSRYLENNELTRERTSLDSVM